MKYGVLFLFGENASSKLMCVVDSYWCGDKVDRRSTFRYLFKYLGSPISWCSKKQPIVALSINEIVRVVEVCYSLPSSIFIFFTLCTNIWFSSFWIFEKLVSFLENISCRYKYQSLRCVCNRLKGFLIGFLINSIKRYN